MKPQKIRVTYRNISPTDAIRGAIDEHMKHLEHFSSRITRGNLCVVLPHHHHRSGNLYQLRLELEVPRKKKIVVTRSPAQDLSHQDLYVVIRDTFNAAERQLRDHVRILRGDVKKHAPITRPLPSSPQWEEDIALAAMR